MSTDTTFSSNAPTTPQVAIYDIGSVLVFLAGFDERIKYFNDC